MKKIGSIEIRSELCAPLCSFLATFYLSSSHCLMVHISASLSQHPLIPKLPTVCFLFTYKSPCWNDIPWRSQFTPKAQILYPFLEHQSPQSLSAVSHPSFLNSLPWVPWHFTILVIAEAKKEDGLSRGDKRENEAWIWTLGDTDLSPELLDYISNCCWALPLGNIWNPILSSSMKKALPAYLPTFLLKILQWQL